LDRRAVPIDYSAGEQENTVTQERSRISSNKTMEYWEMTFEYFAGGLQHIVIQGGGRLLVRKMAEY
jgi:hypothetical protein